MPKPFDVTAGHWWRFDAYEVDGGCIRPRAEAKIETYDPWAAFWECRGRNGPQPPYRALLELERGLEFVPRAGPGPLRQLTAASEKRLLAWCADYGLLGLLPHETIAAWLWPSWEPLPDDDSVLVPTQIQFGRTGEGWTTYSQLHYGMEHDNLKTDPEQRGNPLPIDSMPDVWFKPGALTQPLVGEHCRHHDFKSSWSRFFPDVVGTDPETYRYPAPLSGAFWHAYAEPVEDFVPAVTTLARALKVLGAVTGSHDANDGHVREGMDLLHALTRTVRPTLAPQNGQFRQEWLSTSLLGTFAMMALIDLTEQRRILRCGTCGAVVVTKAYQAVYCSNRCRFTAQKRRYRASQKGVPVEAPS